MASSTRSGLRAWRIGAMAAAGAVALLVLYWVTLPAAEPLRHANPATTAVIEARAEQAREKGRAGRQNQHWVPLSRISPWLQHAVINSEDARFYEHDGIDLTETAIAIGDALDRGHLGRGASTLTQQLAKNLWLGEERSLWRKSREYFLAGRLEKLGKPRILELYLNVVEWGPGVYGADAAARVWFDKPAALLLPEEAAILAAMLPSPRHRNPQRPSAKLRKRAFEVLKLFEVYGEMTPEEYGAARIRLAALLGS